MKRTGFLLKLFLLPLLFTFTALPVLAQDSLSLMHVQGQVYMLSGADVNVTVQAGDDALVFVDSPDPAILQDVMTLVRDISDRPVRYVVATHLDADHISSNQLLSTMGDAAGVGTFGFGPPDAVAAAGAAGGVTILSHENVLNRFYLTEHDIEELTVTTTYFTPSKDFFMNNEGIVVYHMPAAHTDGDSIVYFRRSDVVSTGDIFTPGRYPEIDLAKGGSVNGLIEALNFLLELIVPGPFQEGGTYVIPGHGRISDEMDVLEYRNMLFIVRDRVRHLMEQGQNLQQIIASRPTLDYDTEYGAHRGGPSSEEFITSVFNSLLAE